MQTDRTLPPIRDRAMGYLARREHTPLELARKLEHAGYAEDEIRTVLEELSQRGWLSSERFAAHYVTQKQAKFGSQKLAYELRHSGVEESVIQQALAETRVTELDRAREIWRKKFGKPPNSDSERGHQMRFLQGRGFSFDVCRQAIETVKDGEID